MTPRPPDPALLTLVQAAELLSRGDGDGGRRLRRAVDAQLIRHRVRPSDRDDVRAEVAVALLASTSAERLTLDAASAHVARVARNKAVDLHRRHRHEAPAHRLAERAAPSPDVSLDAVACEVHRRDVSRALVELVRELPSSERRALTATATGAGHLGSGLGRSSHYRALDRARLRLSVAVRSRVAAGLALPALLVRSLDHLRELILPVAVTAAAALAGVAFVLPTITPPAAAYARASVPARLVAATASVAPAAVAAVGRSARVVRVRVPPVRPARAVVQRPIARHPTTRPVATRAEAPPAGGLGPCRAAQLCQ